MSLTEDFLAIYPQFSGLPAAVLADAGADAAERFSDLPDSPRLRARRLYMAHVLTLWSRVALPEAAEPASIWNAGDPQLLASQSLSGANVSRHESAALSTPGGFSEWKQTVFGQQLITLCLASAGGTVYVP